MALVSLEDPGLTVFATHRLLKDLSDEQRERLRDAARAASSCERSARTSSSRTVTTRRSASATWTPTTCSPGGCGSKDPRRSTTALADSSEAYRRLDAAALEALFLKGAVGLSAEDIAAKKRARLHAERGRGRRAS